MGLKDILLCSFLYREGLKDKERRLTQPKIILCTPLNLVHLMKKFILN
jgi:hypothetical protein